MNFEQAVKDIRDAEAIMADLNERRSARLKERPKMLAEIAEYRRRTEQNLVEITDKLNGLIGFVDGMQRPPRPS